MLLRDLAVKKRYMQLCDRPGRDQQKMYVYLSTIIYSLFHNTCLGQMCGHISLDTAMPMLRLDLATIKKTTCLLFQLSFLSELIIVEQNRLHFRSAINSSPVL
jgi:hypothetical protein